MKSNKKKLILGLLVILVLAAAYFLMNMGLDRKQKEQEDEKAKEEENAIVLSLAPDQITELSFEGTDGPVHFVQKDGVWSAPEDSHFVMRDAKINLLLKDLAALTAERTLLISETDGQKQEDYGLGEKASVIDIQAGENSCQLLIGMKNEASHQIYFQTQKDSDKVYLTSTALDSHFSGCLQDFAVYEDFPEISPADMRMFDIQKGDTSFQIVMTGTDECTVQDAEGVIQSADLNLIGVLQNQISNISWAQNVEYYCEDFSLYGLDEPAAVLTVRYAAEQAAAENETVSAETSAGQKNEALQEYVLWIGNQTEDGQYYVRQKDSMEVHTIRGEYLEKFADSEASDFWNLSYSYISVSDLDYLEASSDDVTHQLKCEIDDENNLHWFVNGEEVEKSLFADFYYACVSVTAQERLNEVPEQKDDPVLTLIYHLKDKSEKRIDYYPCDQNFYTVIYENGTKAAHTNKLYVNTMLECFAKLDGEGQTE